MLNLQTFFDRNSIRFQLYQLVLVVSMGVLTISMAGVMLLEWKDQQSQATHALMTIAQATSVAAGAAVAFHDGKAASEALRILVGRKGLQVAALYPVEGRLLASYGAPAPGNILHLSEHFPSLGLFSTSTTLFQPILLDGSPIGYLFIRANLQEYRNKFLLQAALASGINLLGLLLVLGFGLRFVDRLIKPVKELAETSRRVREDKDYSLRATRPMATRHEIDDLIVSFNAMLSEIEQRDGALAQYQMDLERRVQERTQALHQANQELQMAKDSAERASLAKSRFLAAAGHDLRQPIHALGLYGEVLAGTALTEKQKMSCEQISRSTQILGDILDVLLDISQIDAGDVKPKFQPISVDLLFQSAMSEFSASTKPIRFKVHFPSREIWLFSDEKLLRRLLSNLIGNALKYTEQGGVLVGVRTRGEHAVIQIWDTGIGIAKEHIEHVFDEYFQVGNTERDRKKGLGLGLAIGKRLATLLNTELVCHSRLGKGSVFEIGIALADVALPNSPAQTGATGLSVSGLGGRRVVVIDDDPMVAMATKLALESFGMSVTTYPDAEVALAYPGIIDADFYLSDMNLPGLNGLRLLDAIQQRSLKPIRAVLLTGDTALDQIKMSQSSRWQVLYKPVRLSQLLAAIECQEPA